MARVQRVSEILVEARQRVVTTSSQNTECGGTEVEWSVTRQLQTKVEQRMGHRKGQEGSWSYLDDLAQSGRS